MRAKTPAAAERARILQSQTVEIRKQRRAAGLCVFCGGPHPKAAQRRMELQARIAKLQAQLQKLGGSSPAAPIAAPAARQFHGLDPDMPIGANTLKRAQP